MQEIVPGVFVETGIPGCNPGFVVTSEGVVLIDTPEPPSVAVQWVEMLKAHGPVVYIINTEHHIDHILCNPFFEGEVIAHEKTREFFHELSPISGGQIDNAPDFVAKADPDGLPYMEGYVPKEPSITFSDRMTLFSGDEEIRLRNLPSHVVNSTIVHLPRRRLVFTSDLIFNNFMPWLHQCLPQRWLDSLDALEAMDVDILVPSHGEVCDKSYLPVMKATLNEIFDTVRETIRKGMSRDEAVETITFIDQLPIPTEYTTIAPIVQRKNIERVYDQLKGKS